MSESRRFLVVGAGTMGTAYARMFAAGRVPGAELCGVVDVDTAKAAALGAATGVPAYDDLPSAIAALEPGAAYVATPDARHRNPVLILAEAGVPMLVEKPLATTVHDAAEMLEWVERHGVYAEVNYSNRWNPPFVEAKRQIEAGEIGEVRSFNVRLNNPISSPRDRLGWSATTSPAWFLMSHCLDLAWWLGGRRATSVYASGAKGVLAAYGVDTWDWIHATVRYDGGGDGLFEAAWILPESWPGGVEFNFRVLGSDGAIDVDTTFQNIAVSGKRHAYPGTLAWGPARVSAFLRALEGQGKARVPFAEAIEATRILVAIHRSLETGAVEPIA